MDFKTKQFRALQWLQIIDAQGISSYSYLVPDKLQVSVSCGKFTVNIYNEWIRESTLTTVLRAVAHAD